MALSDARFPPSIVRFHCGVQVAFWGQPDRRSDFDSALGFIGCFASLTLGEKEEAS